MSRSVRWVSASNARIDSRNRRRIEPHRLVEPGRKQIEDAAANGVFAGFADRADHGNAIVQRVAGARKPWRAGAVGRARQCRADGFIVGWGT